MVLELLKSNAEINAQTFEGSTPLHEAIRKNHLEIIKLLIHQGADINIYDENGHKPLAFAALIGNPDCLKVFFKSFEETMTPSGLRVELLLVSFLNSPIFRLCPDIFSVINSPECGGTPLHAAVYSKKVDCVRLLLEAGSDANITDYDRFPPLYSALERNYAEYGFWINRFVELSNLL